MTDTGLKSYLSNLHNYNFLVFSDLSTELVSPSTLINTLNAVKKEVFEPNDRIVFYTSHRPSKQVLDHLHKCIELLDVSGFFCVLCCPQDIKQDIDNYIDPISVVQIGLADTAPLPMDFYMPNTVCPLPWMHLEIKHNGDVYPCCVSQFPVASALDTDLDSIMLGDRMSQLRSDFVAGKQPADCKHCWAVEQQGQQSNRQWHVKHYGREFYLNYFNNIKIRSLDLKPGNTCNFKCRICNPVSSSLFADELNSQRKNQIKITDNTARWVEYNDYTWDQLQKLLPNIENLDFYGGEPFLVKEISKLLISAIEQGYSQQMRLHFNSNGSVFPDKLIPILEQFKSVDIALSIDNIGQRFELERGGQWEEVEKNILNFYQLDSTKFTTYIMPTVNIQNVYYLDELFAWANNHQIRVTVNFLNDPDWANINNLTPAAKQLVIDKFIQSEHKELQLLAVRVKTSVGNDGTEFVHQMKRFDRIRSQDFGLTHKEIAQAMGYNLSSSN